MLGPFDIFQEKFVFAHIRMLDGSGQIMVSFLLKK